MPRKTELIAEETAVSSPLRRSSRKTVVANSPAPATITTRRNSQSQTEATETKAPKTRRASLSQENTEKAELVDSKPAPRGRRASTAKEETEQKTEPAKTRSRRSSAASEPPTEEPERKQVVTRRRRSTAVEEELETQSVKPVRARRGSVTDKTIEEDTVKKPIKGRISVKEEETKEEPKKNLRRRNSVTEEIPETDTKEKKLTRGRRPSVDKLDNDNEPEAKTVKVTPVKLKRRQSITENAVNLEPIEEQDSEIKGRISESPPNLNLKKAVVNLTTIKSNKETVNLDLSTIDESSFTDESLNKSTSEKKVVTPRKSPRLNKETVPNSRDSLTPSKSSTHPIQMKETNENVEKNIDQNKANNENVDESICAESMNNKTDEGLENSDSSTRKKLNFEPSSTVEINIMDIAESGEIDIKEETEDVQEKSLICDVSESHTESIDESVLDLECEQEKVTNKQTVEDKNKREYPDISMGSDGSFRFHLNVSLPSTNLENTSQDDNVEDDLNTSKNSNGSDKENYEVNSAEHPNASRVNVGEKLKIIDVNAHDLEKEVKVQQEVVVARVSNVFQPKMIENSFMEPMEVDEYPSILDATQNRKSFDLEESNAPPAISTPIVKRTIQEVDPMEAIETKNENEHKLSIEITENDIIEGSSDVDQVKEESEELEDKYEIIPEGTTVGSEYTKEESEVNPTTKEDNSDGQISKTFPEDTINIEEASESNQPSETKMSTNITVETENLDQSPMKIVEIGKEEHDERSENSLTEEEMEKRQSNNFANNEKLEEATLQIASIQEVEQKLHDIEKAEETDSENREMIPRISKTPPAGRDGLDPEQKLRKSKSPQPELLKSKESRSQERENLVKPLEVENVKDDSSKKFENLEIQNTDIGELESEIEKSSGKPKYLLAKTLVVELESHPTNDGLTPKKDRRSLRKSSSPPSQESETRKHKQRKSLRKSRSPSFERQELETNQNEKNDLPRKSSPQLQIINTAESEILESTVPKKLKDTVESEPEQADGRNSPANQDFVQDSSELKESGKLDISDDYEFDIPSEEEEVDKLQENAIKPIVSEKTDKSDISTTETVETVIHSSPLKRKSNVLNTEEIDTVLSSPLKRKSIVSEVNESERMKITSKSEEGLPDLDCKDAVDKINSTKEQTETTDLKAGGEASMSEGNNELISVTEMKNTKESIDQESNLNKEIADQKGIQEEKDNISLQDEVEVNSISAIENVNSNSTFKKGSPKMDITEMKIDELVVQDVNVVKDVKKNSPVKSLQIHITNDLNVVARAVHMRNTDKESSSKYTVNEPVTFGVEEMESDFKDVIQDSSDIKKGRMNKRKPMKRRNNTMHDVDTMRDEEEVQVDETLEDIKGVGSIKSCEDDCSDNEERKITKKPDKFKKITRNIALDNERKPRQSISNSKDFSSNNPKNNSNDIVEDTKKMKKSKKSKIVLDEDNTELNIEKNSQETVGEEFGSNPSKKEKKHKKQQKPENDNCVESNKKSEEVKQKAQKKISLNTNQDISPRKSSLEGLEPFAMSKLDNYLSKKMSEMESEDESYDTSTTEEDDREENEFISTMAEEGEEDTPSEGSNDIIDEGESINSTESELDTEDDYDENDSFICDEEAAELLSGDEYDLGDKKKKKKEKKSRIIKIDDCDDEIIKIKKKEKPVKKKKRSRIITVSDSSDSDLEKKDGPEGSIEIEEDVDSLSKSLEVNSGVTKETSDKEVTDDEVIILEEQSTPVKSPCNLIVSEANLNISTAEAQTRRKKSSITIHENINVSEIKDTALSERISNMVDSFCTTLYAGEVSMNLSLEHAIVTKVTEEPSQDDDDDVFIKETEKNKKGKRLSLKRRSRDSGDSEAFEEGEPSKKVHRLSVTLDNIESPNELNQEQRKRRSKSLENISVNKSKKKKNKKVSDETKRATVKSLHSKKKTKSKKRGNSKSHTSTDELRTQTFSIMNQLITDVKNRPVRTIKPTVTVIDMNGSWITEVADVRPSTTLVNKRELDDYKSGKIHPKDFRNKMLYDPSRVRRVDTKTLLRKRGAYF